MTYLLGFFSLFLFVLLLSLQLHHRVMMREEDILDEDKMLWAIKKSEGGTHYGIRNCTERACKEICRKTIRRLFKEYHGKGIRGFIRFASFKYVSRNDREGQENWNINVRYFYEHPKKSIK